MSVLVTSLDKCGGGVRDARVAEGADPAVQRLRHLEPQIVGTRGRGATSGGHEAAESAHLVPWTHSFEHSEPRRTEGGAVSINRDLSPPRCPPRHLLPVWAKISSLVREYAARARDRCPRCTTTPAQVVRDVWRVPESTP